MRDFSPSDADLAFRVDVRDILARVLPHVDDSEQRDERRRDPSVALLDSS